MKIREKFDMRRWTNVHKILERTYNSNLINDGLSIYKRMWRMLVRMYQ